MARSEWTQERLEKLILDQIEEGQNIEFKRAASLRDSDEISKDVSAMANAAGGVIIYGIAEGSKPRKHFPEKIDAVRRSECSKERLAQIINSNIRPRINDVTIEAIRLSEDENQCAYVVTVPQGETAHQAADFRYYRRYNFENLRMYDHEIRDVMARSQHPVIQLDFEITWEATVSAEFAIPGRKNFDSVLWLSAIARNRGARTAKHLKADLTLPRALLVMEGWILKTIEDRYADPSIFVFENTTRDIIRGRHNGIVRPVPILPGTGEPIGERLPLDPKQNWNSPDAVIRWEVQADDAPRRRGENRLSEIKLVDRRPPKQRDQAHILPAGATVAADQFAQFISPKG